MRQLVIGTRGSRLAIWQAEFVRKATLADNTNLSIRLEVIRTIGDKASSEPLQTIGGDGLFTKEIENALLSGLVDMAVHSLKDLPTQTPDGLELVAILKRHDPADAIVAKESKKLDDLPKGAKVLAGSPRRQAQLLYRRKDLRILPVRGNVETRLAKLEKSDAAGIVLAAAGLTRLGLAGTISERLDPLEFLPACGQGALAVEIRSDNAALRSLLVPLDHVETRFAVTAERAFLAALGGGCQVPAGAYATSDGCSRFTITGMISDLNGSRLLRDTSCDTLTADSQAEAMGRQLAQKILAVGGDEIIQKNDNRS